MSAHLVPRSWFLLKGTRTSWENVWWTRAGNKYLEMSLEHLVSQKKLSANFKNVKIIRAISDKGVKCFQ